MLGVLQHGGIAKHQQVGFSRIHCEAVSDALCLRHAVAAGHPVAQTHRCLLVDRNSTQQTSCAAVALGGVKMYRMATLRTLIAIVNGSYIFHRIGIGTVAAGDIGGRKVGIVDTSGATLRCECIESVHLPLVGTCRTVGTLSAGIEGVVGQRRQILYAAGR